VKKKLAALDMRIQFAAVAFLLLIIGYAGYSMVVAPQGAQAAKLQRQADAVQFAIFKRKAEIKKGLHPPTIETADLFRLARAMPDRTDMPGIILTLSDLARSAGIKFDLIEPVTGGATPSGSYETDRIHLLFNGDFYGLSDFLYRLRSLVSVHDGKLNATGRLFNADTVTFNVLANAFPKISAELFVNAYVYGATAPPAPAAPTTTNPDGTTTTTTSPTTTTPAAGTATPPAGATAAGPTP
jgi:Tfp pilus assembly protein PilO